MTQGEDHYYSLNSLWMDYQEDAEYEFGVTYRNYWSSYFQANYQDNKNLYAMYLPSTCRKFATLRPTSSLFIHYCLESVRSILYLYTLSGCAHFC